MKLPVNIEKMTAGLDFRVDDIGMSDSQVLCFEDMVLKIEPRSQQTDNEAAMMRWLDGRLPVPKLLAHEHADGLSFLLMSRVEGKMLCDAEILCKPNELVGYLVDALNMLWTVDISDAPAIITLDEKLRIASQNVAEGRCNTNDAEPDTYGPNGFESPEKLLYWLKDNKPQERLVLSHGDLCLPNIFVNADKVNGFIDLGRCGVSDKYQDIALCWRSLCHNYDGRYGKPMADGFNADILFDALGLIPDRELLRYYILLDELF